MAFWMWAPLFWNPWMFVWPEFSAPSRKPLKRDEPEK